MKISEALSFVETKLTAVAFGGTLRLDEKEVLDMLTTINGVIPRVTQDSFFRGAHMNDKNMMRELDEFDENHKPGYYGTVTLPTGAVGIYTKGETGSNFIGVDLTKIKKGESDQLGFAHYFLNIAYNKARNEEFLSAKDLAPTLEASQIEKHLNWIARKTSR